MTEARKPVGDVVPYDEKKFGPPPALNPYEESAREAKCQKLAQYLVRVLIKAVTEQDQGKWKNAASHAGVNTPSPESQARVIEILRSVRPTERGWNL